MTDEKIDVLTVGHALVDVLASTDDAFLQANDVAKGSMTLIDDGRAADLYGAMPPAAETSGGSAANTAVGVVACGGTAAYIGTVAEDALGEVFAHDLRSTGVTYGTAPISGKLPTGRSFILVTPDGERSMNTNIGVAGAVSQPHFDNDLFKRARVTYVEGYLFDDAHPVDAWVDALELIHRSGNQFAISLSDPFCVERHRKTFLGLLDGRVDVCFGNEEEVCSLFETNSLEIALDQLAKQCEVGAVTLGARGSVLVCGNTRVEVPAEPTTVVDTTGAGDLYAAGVLTGIAKGWDLDQCGKLGSLAAASVIGTMGARPAGPISL